MVTTDKVLLNDWHVVASVEECSPGTIKPVTLLGEDLIVWRSSEPDSPILVWRDYCPHRGARLSLGEVGNQTLMCGYHGWVFDGDGKCLHIPAHPDLKPSAGAKVKTYHCQERYGLVWVCLGEPAVDIPSFPEWEDSSYRKFLCGPYPFNSSGPRVIENAVDMSHFPFIHEGGLGDRSQAVVPDYEVETDGEGVIVRNIRNWQPSSGTPINGVVERWQRVCRPLTVYAFINFPSGIRTILYTVTPVQEDKSIVWMWVATNFEHDTPLSDLVGFQDRLGQEDALFLETQRPVALPLIPHDSTSNEWPIDLHVPSDRLSVAYRRWLKELGLTFGVC